MPKTRELITDVMV